MRGDIHLFHPTPSWCTLSIRRAGLPVGLFPSHFVLAILYAFLFVYSCYMRRHSYRPDIYLRRDEVKNLLITHFSPVTSALSDPKLHSNSYPLFSVQAFVCLLLTVPVIAGWWRGEGVWGHINRNLLLIISVIG